MKKFTILILAFCILTALELEAKGPFSHKSNDLNFGIGFTPLSIDEYYGDMSIPVISASYDFGFPWGKNKFTEKLSLGGYAAFYSTEYKYVGWWTYTYTYTHILIGVRGCYHFYNEDNIDAYGGVVLGYDIVSSSYSSTGNSLGSGTSAGSTSFASAIGGARYYFSPGFGVYGELGLGYSYPLLSFGLTLKL